MSKKRKTRKQKEITQLRHQLSQQTYLQPDQEVAKPQEKFTFVSTRSIQQSINVVTIQHYPYIPKELKKTAVVSLTIIFFEIVLFYLLKSHVVVLPNLIY